MRYHSSLALLLFLAAFALLPSSARAQSTELFRSWNHPIEPFRIVGNVYYVGASDVASYLITTPQGHILLEGGFAETAPLIRTNVRKLGFQLSDIRILLSSHAHLDHAGGLAELKQATGARLLAGAADAPLLASGGKGDFQWGDRLPFPPVQVTAALVDGERIEFGGVVLTAHLTPGHTRGNLTFTMRVEEHGRGYDVVFCGSISAPGYQFIDNQSYPEIAADFARSVAMLKTLPCDVFLAPHGSFFDLKEKRQRQVNGVQPNPFIDLAGYRQAVAKAEATLVAQLMKERAVTSGNVIPVSAVGK